eukprot:CAMPEP_0168504040 /NCGR_PEP_ID=MMETSP0228-20121227/76165_1 /TAXON_ID=133427 /ORGANISM="Protoceratium reticulatum, Strain CCCM 535 (=CCMP 1889)" /LENGTH=91 /DNA_ID=CAMNT_0008521113 /DNA_START=323 /DNA_END=595 /DNA_ORIENTATION=-
MGFIALSYLCADLLWTEAQKVETGDGSSSLFAGMSARFMELLVRIYMLPGVHACLAPGAGPWPFTGADVLETHGAWIRDIHLTDALQMTGA